MTHTTWQTVSKGYIVAQAYKWIGQRELPPALTNLQALLEYKYDARLGLVKVPELVFVTVVWSYLTLASAGFVSEVLLYLAEEVSDLSFARVEDLSVEQEAYRDLKLEALLLVFVLLVRLSLSGSYAEGTYSIGFKLEERPDLPDKEGGRDVLLAVVLSQEEPELRSCLVQLFCAAVIEERADAAFELLEEWARIALQKHETETRKLARAYRQFLGDIGALIDEWGREMEESSDFADVTDKYELFIEKLEGWIEKHEDTELPSPLVVCVQDVLERLSRERTRQSNWQGESPRMISLGGEG